MAEPAFQREVYDWTVRRPAPRARSGAQIRVSLDVITKLARCGDRRVEALGKGGYLAARWISGPPNRCRPRVTCGSCNLGLGHFGDDPDRLQAAARYLQQFSPADETP